MMKYSMTGTDRTGITSAPGNIQFICAMLGGGALREFDFIASHVGSKINGHLKQIKEGFTKLIPPPQRAQQAEARHEACNEETLRYTVQDICSTTNIIK